MTKVGRSLLESSFGSCTHPTYLCNRIKGSFSFLEWQSSNSTKINQTHSHGIDQKTKRKKEKKNKIPSLSYRTCRAVEIAHNPHQVADTIPPDRQGSPNPSRRHVRAAAAPAIRAALSVPSLRPAVGPQRNRSEGRELVSPMGLPVSAAGRRAARTDPAAGAWRRGRRRGRRRMQGQRQRQRADVVPPTCGDHLCTITASVPSRGKKKGKKTHVR